MARLRTKSVRYDCVFDAEDWNPSWAWSPDRAIKIKGISCTLDQPNANGTSWMWLSRGSVPMTPPDPGPNEDEMVFFTMGQRTETPGGVEAENTTLAVMFGADHIDVHDGEKIYLNVRGTDTNKMGISLIIYYI